MITLTNDYHHTSVRLRANVGDYLTTNQIKRAAQVLCPAADCFCGHGDVNSRGRQDGFYIEFGRVIEDAKT